MVGRHPSIDNKRDIKAFLWSIIYRSARFDRKVIVKNDSLLLLIDDGDWSTYRTTKLQGIFESQTLIEVCWYMDSCICDICVVQIYGRFVRCHVYEATLIVDELWFVV